MKNQEIICVGCPCGCHITLTVDESGKIVKFDGNECSAGKKYAAEEFKTPVRIFTGTVKTEGSSRPLLSVRTNKPVVKTSILKCGEYLSNFVVKSPIKIGSVVIPNILDTEADLIATADLD